MGYWFTHPMVKVLMSMGNSTSIRGLSTTFSMPRLIMGANVFKDLFAAVRDIVGGRSGAYEKALDQARRQALADLQGGAADLGADAVIGIDLETQSSTITFEVTPGGAGEPAMLSMQNADGSTSVSAINSVTCSGSLAQALHHGEHPEYVWWTAAILAMDSVGAVAFARLRAENRAPSQPQRAATRAARSTFWKALSSATRW